MHFSLLWSRFECRRLAKEANAKGIVSAVKEWSSGGRLTGAEFDSWLSYYRERYFQNGNFTQQFRLLKFRSADKETLVKDVISGKKTDIGDCLGALLIIIWRIRNNFFHGEKWGDVFADDYDNFRHANSLLMYILEWTDRGGENVGVD